ncbi:MAG: hypothetical protein ACK45U_02590 [bacterium]
MCNLWGLSRLGGAMKSPHTGASNNHRVVIQKLGIGIRNTEY